MKRQLHASIWQEGEWFVAQCLEEDVASQGHSEEEALQHLAEALRLHFAPPIATAKPRLRVLEVELNAA